MTHDVVIRGGTIVDGLGGEPYAAEIAVRGDTIVEIGSVSEAGGDRGGRPFGDPGVR